MNQALEHLNRFLDDDVRAPSDDDQRAAARIIAHLEPTADPDSAFLGNLERQLVAASQPSARLIALPAAQRVCGGAKPWRTRAASFSAAALLTVIILGAAFGGWRLLGQDRSRPGAVLPAAMSSPSSAPASTPEMVSMLDYAVLYAGPSKDSAALATFHIGAQLEFVGSTQTSSVRWLQMRIPGTRIIGWGLAYSPFDPVTDIYKPGPSAPPAIISTAPPKDSGTLARVSGKVGVWSKPGPDMTMIWIAIPSDRLTLTGERIDQLGATWVQVRNEALNEDGWIAADFLFAAQSPEASPAASPVAQLIS